MSYILEALKKAEAERQLGSTPTLLAVPVGAAPPGAAIWRLRWLSTILATVGVAAALVAAWQFKTPAPKAPAPVVVAAAPAPKPAPAPAQAMVVPPLAVIPPSSPEARPKPEVVRLPPPVKASVPAVPAAPAPAPVAVPAPAPEEEKLQTLRELPEAIQRSVPPLVFGGYMYSKNPVDRLLLIDKTLRHEGDEVAPGLVLEKLLPKAAVMNYKGYRYRVPY
jgi:general secretion pathway protein B